jgi:glycosyltransferase involved in cell wall biosynthesis
VKLAFVVPRYGPEIIGGAETAARLLAEHLVACRDWSVEVLTTCARDFVTWDNEYPPGDELVNGVLVRRFTSTQGREPSFHPLSAALLADPVHASGADAERWLDLQGPICPDLTEAALESSADALAFYPYLYWPTARVIDRVTLPTILHPAAHDEPALFLPVFPRVFGAASGLVFQTTAERELVQRTFPVAERSQLLLGLGVDDPDLDTATGHTGSERPDPYLVCLGRVEGHKGSRLLASLFSAYKARRPGPLRLVFAGPVVEEPDPHPEIDVLGPVDDATKWTLLRHAVALVSPSPWEAFSLVLAEAWSARTPVVANAACAATSEHCQRSGGGLVFAGYGEFEAVVDRLVADGALRDELGVRGRSYVDQHFRWPTIVDRYARFVGGVVDRSS